MHGQIFYSNWYLPQPSPNTHCGPAPPRALPPLNLLQLFLVLANHICERRHILVCLLQQVCQTLVFLVVNHLTISLLILRLCEVYMHILPQWRWALIRISSRRVLNCMYTCTWPVRKYLLIGSVVVKLMERGKRKEERRRRRERQLMTLGEVC